MLFDTHSHLFDEAFDADREECIKRCKDKNMKLMIVGFTNENNQTAYNLAQQYGFYSSAGIHPSEAGEHNYEEILKLEEFIKTHKVYAIGECGLDYHWVNDNKELQKELFIEQIKLSIKYNLPIIIHGRDAVQDIYDILKQYPKAYGILHCYSGSLEMAKEFVKLGYYISLGGPLTFKNAKEPKRVCEGIPLERLLIETDCPYLAPTPYRGQRNESSYVSLVLEEMSKIKGIDTSEMENITYRNACNVFHIKEAI